MSDIKNNEPRINRDLLAQFKEQRFGLISKIKALREERNKLKGVKNTGPQWEALTAQIDEVQKQIDLIGKSLGIKPKANHHQQPTGTKPGVPYNQVKKDQVRAGRDPSKPNRRSHRGNLQARNDRKLLDATINVKDNFVPKGGARLYMMGTPGKAETAEE